MNELIYRSATLDDLAQLLVLEQKLVDAERPFDPLLKEPAAYYNLPDLICSADSNVIVVEVDGEIIGSGYGQIKPSKVYRQYAHHCYLGFIFVEPSFRGQKIAAKIIDKLKHWGLERSVSHFCLDVYENNASAVRAYEQAGFRKVLVRMELVASNAQADCD